MNDRGNVTLKWIFGGLALCAAGFWASPYIAATRFAHAAANGDAAAIAAQLDIPRIRMGFARQIVRAYPVDPVLVAALDPPARYAANVVAASYVDALIAEHLTSEMVVKALSTGSIAGANSAGSSLNLPAMQQIDGAWGVFQSAGFTGPLTFAVDVLAQPEGRYRLGFRLVGGTWKLTSVGLPVGVLTRAVDMLKQRRAAGQLG